MPYRELEDGTRIYDKGRRYKPIGKQKRNKPDDPRAVLHNGRWYLPLNVLPDDARVMPVTKPDLSRDRPKGYRYFT